MANAWKILAVACCLALPGWGLADEEDPDAAAAHVRHALMELMGWNITLLGAMASGERPYDADKAATQAQRLSALGNMISDAFERNTSGADIRTEALDAIWQNPDDFGGKAQAMLDAAAAYAAATGDGEAAAKVAFARLGKTCKSCHEEYKSE